MATRRWWIGPRSVTFMRRLCSGFGCCKTSRRCLNRTLNHPLLILGACRAGMWSLAGSAGSPLMWLGRRRS